MTTPAPVKSSSTIVSGTSIDICDVPETKYESVLTMAEAFVRKNQFSGAAAAKPETSLISITLGQAFYNVIDARGYFARFKPGATMQPDVLHPNLAYGHLAAMSVNLENCPLYANGEIDGRADAEMYWAAFGAPVPPITEPTNSLIASDSDIDARVSAA